MKRISSNQRRDCASVSSNSRGRSAFTPPADKYSLAHWFQIAYIVFYGLLHKWDNPQVCFVFAAEPERNRLRTQPGKRHEAVWCRLDRLAFFVVLLPLCDATWSSVKKHTCWHVYKAIKMSSSPVTVILSMFWRLTTMHLGACVDCFSSPIKKNILHVPRKTPCLIKS